MYPLPHQHDVSVGVDHGLQLDMVQPSLWCLACYVLTNGRNEFINKHCWFDRVVSTVCLYTCLVIFFAV